MSNYITIDGGTTNTRIALVAKSKTLEVRRFPIGAGNAGFDNPEVKQTLRQCIQSILSDNNMPESAITRILASGMITSDRGLVNLPHIPAPAGIDDLHSNLCETTIAEVSSVPFVFVPGLKIQSENFERSDMLRGEETELIGLFRGEGLYILPGSHSKLITVDGNRRITAFETMLTGEMITALSQNTILKDSIHLKAAKTDGEFLRKGYEYCRTNGINAALFKARVLDKLYSQTSAQVYSFFMGAVLCGEIDRILQKKPKRIILSGRTEIKEAMAVLLTAAASAAVEMIRDEEAEQATRYGAIKIYEHR